LDLATVFTARRGRAGKLRCVGFTGTLSMHEFNVDIKSADGIVDTFICHPEGGGLHPRAIFYMNAPAIREELRDMARRLGTAGYYVMLPNLFYRRARPADYRENTIVRRRNKH
jgi:dienelactone hydrolase